MALPEDFDKIYGSTATGGLTPISDVNYAKGWEFVGSNPPTKNDFSYLQNLSDMKSQWLYLNKQDKDATLTTLSGKDANGILQYLGYESGSGWVKLPGGLIIQFGRIGHPVGVTSVQVTLPRAFTSLEYSITHSWSDVQNLSTGDIQSPAINGTQFSSRTLTTFQSWQAGAGGFNTDYIAIGY